MRRSWSGAALAVMVSVAAFGLASPAGGAEGDFIVDGGGWGHGVGMSQYGAQAMALDDRSVAGIIDHYYSGAQLADSGSLDIVEWIFEPQALAVNVASKRPVYRFLISGNAVTVCHRDAEGAGCDEFSVESGERLEVTTEDGETCTSFIRDGSEVVEESETDGSCSIDLSWDDEFGDGSPSTYVYAEGFTDGGWSRELSMARGPVHIRPHNDPKADATTNETFDVTVRLGLEEYLFGVAEMPLSWELEALKAQAVTARSFAIRTVAAAGGVSGNGRIADCGCHIRRTPAHQVYSGWTVEGYNSLGHRWKNEAVLGTEGLVVTHPDVSGVVTTYYSSSTGGWTENVEDVFGPPSQPHLRSVRDEWSIDPAVRNPFATWQATVGKDRAASYLGWDEVRQMELVAGPPGSTIRFKGVKSGAAVEATRTGWQAREAFDLRSPYIAAIQVEGPPPPPFTDIAASVHYDDIAYIWRADVTKGCNPPDNTLFCPLEPVTRQQMASFLVRALGLPAADTDQFTDDQGSVHEGDINALAAAGVTRGCNPPDNTRFCPQQRVTRGQMAAFLVRAYQYSDSGAGDLFSDDNGSIFEGDIDRLAVAGVTKGCNPPDNTLFCPLEPVTRQQMASFLARAMSQAEG